MLAEAYTPPLPCQQGKPDTVRHRYGLVILHRCNSPQSAPGPPAPPPLTRHNAPRSILSHDPSLSLALGTPQDPGAGTDQGNRVRCGPLAWPEHRPAQLPSSPPPHPGAGGMSVSPPCEFWNTPRLAMSVLSFKFPFTLTVGLCPFVESWGGGGTLDSGGTTVPSEWILQGCPHRTVHCGVITIRTLNSDHDPDHDHC